MGKKKISIKLSKVFTNRAVIHTWANEIPVSFLSYFWNAQISSCPSPSLMPPGLPTTYNTKAKSPSRASKPLIVHPFPIYLTFAHPGLWAATGNLTIPGKNDTQPLHPHLQLPCIWLNLPILKILLSLTLQMKAIIIIYYNYLLSIIISIIIIYFPCLSHPLDYDFPENRNYDLFFCTPPGVSIISADNKLSISFLN